ncbi:MAG: hypothetical protein JNJ98_16035 [Gemmatimonadetes bacterium]|nr:hypothetical protein [Gemmatimonadota bacterium]
MNPWLKRLRGALGMGVTWALGWGLIGGLIMEGLVDRDGRVLDMWPQALAIPGFVCGVAFSVVLGIAARRRRFDELSVPRFAAWGAIAGGALGGLALAAGAMPLVTPLWLRAVGLLGPVAVLCAGSAAGTLAIARAGGGTLPSAREAPPRLPGDAS